MKRFLPMLVAACVLVGAATLLFARYDAAQATRGQAAPATVDCPVTGVAVAADTCPAGKSDSGCCGSCLAKETSAGAPANSAVGPAAAGACCSTKAAPKPAKQACCADE